MVDSRLKSFTPLLILSLTFLLFVDSSVAQDLEGLITAQKDYVARYIKAINAKDMDRLKQLMHPDYLNCIDQSNQDYFMDVFQRSLKYDIPESYEASVEAISEEAALKEVEGAQQMGSPYPVKPTHQLTINFTTNRHSSVTIVRKLVREKGSYYEVFGCPSFDSLERFREVKIKKETERLRSKRLFEELKDPLLLELTILFKEGRKIEAWKKYSDTTGETLATAKEVLSYIEIDNH